MLGQELVQSWAELHNCDLANPTQNGDPTRQLQERSAKYGTKVLLYICAPAAVQVAEHSAIREELYFLRPLRNQLASLLFWMTILLWFQVGPLAPSRACQAKILAHSHPVTLFACFDATGLLQLVLVSRSL